MMKTISIIAVLASSLIAQPLAPYIETLDENEIRVIPLHAEIDTLLVFPEQVDSIIGNGLVKDGGNAGSVLFQQGVENPKTVILRHVDSRSKAIMTVMTGNQVFVFRLEASEKPATVVRFKKPGEAQTGQKITPEQALLRARSISEERKTELLRLARESSFLKDRLASEYEGFSDKAVSFGFVWNGLETKVTRVSRFSKDDALIFSGTITNLRDQSAGLSNSRVMLQVGNRSLYPVNLLRTDKLVIPPHASASFEGLLLGNGAGSPLHPSLENEFHLQLTQKP